MVTPGSPSPKCWSGCLSQWHCTVSAASCDCRDYGASFSTGLFLEENFHITYSAVELQKRQCSIYCPCSSMPTWMGAGWCRATTDAGTHGRCWYPLPGASLWHARAPCLPAGKAPLSHTLVKNARVVALWKTNQCISVWKWCLLLLWVALLML